MSKLHRVLLHVEHTSETEMVVRIPSWKDRLITVSKSILPKGMPVLPDDYLLAEVNLDASTTNDLNIQEVSENLGPTTEEQMNDFWLKAEANVQQR